jgi:hypothetical protein
MSEDIDPGFGTYSNAEMAEMEATRQKQLLLRKVNLIKRIISYPVRLALFVPFAVIGFFMTDWTSEWEVDFYKKTNRSFYKL